MDRMGCGFSCQSHTGIFVLCLFCCEYFVGNRCDLCCVGGGLGLGPPMDTPMSRVQTFLVKALRPTRPPTHPNNSFKNERTKQPPMFTHVDEPATKKSIIDDPEDDVQIGGLAFAAQRGFKPGVIIYIPGTVQGIDKLVPGYIHCGL